MRRLLICLIAGIVLVMVVASMVFGKETSRVIGNNAGITSEKASSLALELTPMKAITETQSTAPGPVMMVVYGVDNNNRKLACWFQGTNLKGLVYLDQGVSRETAVSIIKSKGYDVGESLPILTNPQNPYWDITVWVDSSFGHKIGKKTAVDFKSGEVK